MRQSYRGASDPSVGIVLILSLSRVYSNTNYIGFYHESTNYSFYLVAGNVQLGRCELTISIFIVAIYHLLTCLFLKSVCVSLPSIGFHFCRPWYYHFFYIYLNGSTSSSRNISLHPSSNRIY